MLCSRLIKISNPHCLAESCWLLLITMILLRELGYKTVPLIHMHTHNAWVLRGVKSFQLTLCKAQEMRVQPWKIFSTNAGYWYFLNSPEVSRGITHLLKSEQRPAGQTQRVQPLKDRLLGVGCAPVAVTWNFLCVKTLHPFKNTKCLLCIRQYSRQ